MSLPKGYVDTEYLRVVGALLNQVKQRTYDLMQIRTGHKVLDIGCGPGTDTIPLAHRVGSSGQVCGVDYDQAMVAEADQRAQNAGVSAWVQHKRADALSLPFESGYFDSSRSERMFEHLRHPVQALAEMTRVTKIDGWVVVADADWGTCSTDTTEVDIERRLARFFAEETLYNGYSGRRLFALFKKQGLTDISVEICPVATTNYTFARQILLFDKLEQAALAANIITEAELRRWRTDLEQADAEGRFFNQVCGVLVAGRKTVG